MRVRAMVLAGVVTALCGGVGPVAAQEMEPIRLTQSGAAAATAASTQAPVVIQGQGIWSSPVFELEPGLYRVSYEGRGTRNLILRLEGVENGQRVSLVN